MRAESGKLLKYRTSQSVLITLSLSRTRVDGKKGMGPDQALERGRDCIDLDRVTALPGSGTLVSLRRVKKG